MFKPGGVWCDAAGRVIQAHGGGVLYDRGTYYWFGENKDGWCTGSPAHPRIATVRNNARMRRGASTASQERAGGATVALEVPALDAAPCIDDTRDCRDMRIASR